MQHNLRKLEHNGYIYLEIQKCIPGLKQDGKFGSSRLKRHLEQYGYCQTTQTLSIWRHKTRPTAFTLVVNDFRVKYEGLEHFQHLYNALRNLYEITIDILGSKYLGMNLHWYYDNKTADISMPGYVEKAIRRFQHCGITLRSRG